MGANKDQPWKRNLSDNICRKNNSWCKHHQLETVWQTEFDLKLIFVFIIRLNWWWMILLKELTLIFQIQWWNIMSHELPCMFLKEERVQRFWKGVALYVGHHGWPTKNFRFQMVWKGQNNVRTISFWQNISISIFKFPQKNKKNKKTNTHTHTHRKVGLCFITGCFIKSFNIIINHFFVS